MALALGAWPVAPRAAAQTVRLELQGRALEGKPLAWSTRTVSMLLKDGSYLEFPPDEARNYAIVSKDFRPYSAGEMRAALLREFSGDFDVTGTGQYLVVHPRGQRDTWSDRFEQLYRSMLAYFRSRGFAVQRPEFPLVAVVFATQQQFVDYARASGIRGVTPYTLGLYHVRSNRIYLYDVTAGRPQSPNWYLNAETIIHEAAHQTAFNIGIHARFAETPAWVVEGLGTLFEAPGVWNSGSHRQFADRINTAQLRLAKQYLRDEAASLRALYAQLGSDRLFSDDFELAYSHAWALTFYLTEKEPARYAAYLRRLSQRETGAPYDQETRLRDFSEHFGTDLKLIDAKLRRFVQGL